MPLPFLLPVLLTQAPKGPVRTLPPAFYMEAVQGEGDRYGLPGKEWTRFMHRIWRPAGYKQGVGISWDGTLAWKVPQLKYPLDRTFRSGLAAGLQDSVDDHVATRKLSVRVVKAEFVDEMTLIQVEVAVLDAQGTCLAAVAWGMPIRNTEEPEMTEAGRRCAAAVVKDLF